MVHDFGAPQYSFKCNDYPENEFKLFLNLISKFEFGSFLDCHQPESSKISLIDPIKVDDGINSTKVEISNFLSVNQFKTPFNLSSEEKGISIENNDLMCCESDPNSV
jgi:hypothetical protein